METETPKYLEQMRKQSQESGAYLTEKVLPSIHPALETVLKERDDDPIHQLATLLKTSAAALKGRSSIRLPVSSGVPTKPSKDTKSEPPAANSAAADDWYQFHNAYRLPKNGSNFHSPRWNQSGPYRVFTIVSPAATELDQLIRSISDQNKTVKRIQFFLLSLDEVLYLDNEPYVGTLARKRLTKSQLPKSPVVPTGGKSKPEANLSVEEHLFLATEEVYTAALESSKINAALPEDLVRNACERLRLQVAFRHLPIGFINFGNLGFTASILKECFSSGTSKFEDETAVVFLAYEDSAVQQLPRLAMIPTVAFHVFADHRRLARAIRSGEEAPPSPKAKDVAESRLVAQHEKLMNRRVLRGHRRREKLELSGDNLKVAAKQAEKNREERHAQQEQAYLATLSNEQGEASIKIQSIFRGHRTRSRVQFQGQPDVDRHQLFERTAGTVEPTASTVEGDFALVQYLGQHLVDFDSNCFTLDRPLKPLPPKTFKQLRHSSKRVPPQWDGDISSEDELIESVAYATRPPPVSSRQRLFNPIFHVLHCYDFVKHPDLAWLAQLKENFIPLISTNKRAFAAVEEQCVMVCVAAFLLQTIRSDSRCWQPKTSDLTLDDEADLGLGAWCLSNCFELIRFFSEPSIISRSLVGSVTLHVNSSGPVYPLGATPQEERGVHLLVDSPYKGLWESFGVKLTDGLEDSILAMGPNEAVQVGPGVWRMMKSGCIYVAYDPLSPTEWKGSIVAVAQNYKEEVEKAQLRILAPVDNRQNSGASPGRAPNTSYSFSDPGSGGSLSVALEAVRPQVTWVSLNPDPVVHVGDTTYICTHAQKIPGATQPSPAPSGSSTTTPNSNSMSKVLPMGKARALLLLQAPDIRIFKSKGAMDNQSSQSLQPTPPSSKGVTPVPNNTSTGTLLIAVPPPGAPGQTRRRSSVGSNSKPAILVEGAASPSVSPTPHEHTGLVGFQSSNMDDVDQWYVEPSVFPALSSFQNTINMSEWEFTVAKAVLSQIEGNDGVLKRLMRLADDPFSVHVSLAPLQGSEVRVVKAKIPQKNLNAPDSGRLQRRPSLSSMINRTSIGSSSVTSTALPTLQGVEGDHHDEDSPHADSPTFKHHASKRESRVRQPRKPTLGGSQLRAKPSMRRVSSGRDSATSHMDDGSGDDGKSQSSVTTVNLPPPQQSISGPGRPLGRTSLEAETDPAEQLPTNARTVVRSHASTWKQLKDEFAETGEVFTDYARLPIYATADVGLFEQIDNLVKIVRTSLPHAPNFEASIKPPVPSKGSYGGAGGGGAALTAVGNSLLMVATRQLSKPIVMGISQPYHLFFVVLASLVVAVRNQWNVDQLKAKKEELEAKLKMQGISGLKQQSGFGMGMSIDLYPSSLNPSGQNNLIPMVPPPSDAQRRPASRRESLADIQRAITPAISEAGDNDKNGEELKSFRSPSRLTNNTTLKSPPSTSTLPPIPRDSVQTLPAVAQLLVLMPEIKSSVDRFDDQLLDEIPGLSRLLQLAKQALSRADWGLLSASDKRIAICEAVIRSEEVCLLLLYHYHLSSAVSIRESCLVPMEGEDRSESHVPSFANFLAGGYPKVLEWWRRLNPWSLPPRTGPISPPTEGDSTKKGTAWTEPINVPCPDPLHPRYTNSVMRRRIYQRPSTVFK